ncbi:polysaccharide deacetylase family protein [Oceanobacillus sojae]|uniref:polysaccharide deacetylase family protein n=1 Tax=Oceanobacillus sojae TaxID=582851 RepID=UPI0021A3E59B|nr:polysaccharide deacetylase family protein [Oceanobacillus sojae]MCT1901928.1 polysaccharide deacetylase family protein [Oceanobacillus sojae]
MYEKLKNLSIHPGGREMAGWEQILLQEKIPYELSDNTDFNIKIFPKEVKRSDMLDYVANGGVGIIEKPGDIEELNLWKSGEALVSTLNFPEININHVAAPTIVDIYDTNGIGHVNVHEQRLIKYDMKIGYHPIIVKIQHGKGYLLVVSCELSKLLGYYGDTLREYSSYTKVTERVSAIDKRNISAALVYLLKLAHQLAGIPYIGLWYYPEKEKTLFMFRVDVDGAEGHNTEKMSDISKNYGVEATFYVNKDLCINDLDFLQAIDSFHTIGNHGDIHNVFDSFQENETNILSCQEWLLNNLGVDTNLYVSPRGLWNESLALVLEKLGFKSSSDFGFHIDGFPFHPVVNGKRLNLLQIPVHPHNVGRAQMYAKESGNVEEIDPKNITNYYKKIIDEKEERNEPIMLFGHPYDLGYEDDVLNGIFSHMKEKDIKPISISKFTDWWLKRSETDIEVHVEKSSNTYAVETSDKDVSIYIQGEGDKVILPDNKIIDIHGSQIIASATPISQFI